MHSQKHKMGSTTAASASSRASAQPQVKYLPPFCFECLDMATDFDGFAAATTTTAATTQSKRFYLVTCGRILCLRCCIKEGMTAANYTVQCREHNGRSERCILINARLPPHLLALFRLDHEAQCIQMCKSWNFVSHVHERLAQGLDAKLAAGGRLVSEEKVAAEEAAMRAQRTEDAQMCAARCDELEKLRTETQMAESKLTKYMQMYESRHAKKAASSSTSSQMARGAGLFSQSKYANKGQNPVLPPSAASGFKTSASSAQAQRSHNRPPGVSTITRTTPAQPVAGGGGGGSTARPSKRLFTGDSGLASVTTAAGRSTNVQHISNASTPLSHITNVGQRRQQIPAPNSNTTPGTSASSLVYANFRDSLHPLGAALQQAAGVASVTTAAGRSTNVQHISNASTPLSHITNVGQRRQHIPAPNSNTTPGTSASSLRYANFRDSLHPLGAAGSSTSSRVMRLKSILKNSATSSRLGGLAGSSSVLLSAGRFVVEDSRPEDAGRPYRQQQQHQQQHLRSTDRLRNTPYPRPNTQKF